MKRINTIIAAVALVAAGAMIAPTEAHADRGGRHSLYGTHDHGGYASNRYDNRYGYNYGYRNRYTQYGPRYGRNGTSQIIRNGVRSGRLSEREVRDLREDSRDIRRKEREYMSDGYLSRNERSDLRDEYKDYREDLQHNLRDGERRR